MIAETPNPEDVKEAIRLRCANCWGALSFANSIGGTLTGAWKLAHGHTLEALLDHAREAGISLEGLQAAVEEQPIERTMYYRRATGEITEEQFRAEFRRWRMGQ